MQSGISASRESAAISAALNSCLMLQLLMGIYTVVYAGTMYLCLSKSARSKSRRLVIFVISGLYLSCLGISVLQWSSLHHSIVTQGETRESAYLSVIGSGPMWSYVLLNMLFYGLFVMADGLLVWRCYQVYKPSTMVLLVLLAFFFVELGLFIAGVLITGITGPNRTIANITLTNKLRGALYFASFATTVTTTSLIAHRLHRAYHAHARLSVKLESMAPRRGGWLRHIAAVLVESAAVYSLVILVYAIGNAASARAGEGASMRNVAMYLEVVVAVTGGMAPTVLVARIAITDPDYDTGASIRISTLRFHGQHASDSNSTRADEENGPSQMDDR
ncbi:hypothetical protein JR316_0006259 [Psilocybe cubensis]|uniref:Uncharacterized protein n=2 Tax=Psilocybe cubensis TaxID=181762 RepID=A0ACB8H213_PSICU|nr:hypothetical protein JR316_0006259 [Psilocybe cubensis]KAH9481732.1 hypothetical protein JR316_0006259 [Psilocybe cubensis]